MQVFLEWQQDWITKTFSKKLTLKYASNTFSQTIARKKLLMLTAAKLKLQTTCFPVVCPRLDENDGINVRKIQKIR